MFKVGGRHQFPPQLPWTCCTPSVSHAVRMASRGMEEACISRPKLFPCTQCSLSIKSLWLPLPPEQSSGLLMVTYHYVNDGRVVCRESSTHLFKL